MRGPRWISERVLIDQLHASQSSIVSNGTHLQRERDSAELFVCVPTSRNSQFIVWVCGLHERC